MLGQRFTTPKAFTSAELLVSMAVGAIVVSAAVVAFGSFARIQPRVGSRVTVPLPTGSLMAYYGVNQSTRETAVAPNYGVLAKAEMLRERFLADTLSATAVFCLSRSQPNSYHPRLIPYDPAESTAIPLDSHVNFRKHLESKLLVPVGAFNGSSSFDFHSPTPVPSTATNTLGDTYNYGASIFVLGFSPYATQMQVTAVYDIDVDKVALPVLLSNRKRGGFYGSVKRWAYDPGSSQVRLTDYYDVFYPPSNEDTFRDPANRDREPIWPQTNDQFAPLWVSFERRSRRTGAVASDRFRIAKAMPFYFVWWPDPAVRNLGATRAVLQPPSTSVARAEYYHMAGRTAFMFTVPMFPASS